MTRELPRVTIPETSQYIHRPNIENSIREKHHLYRRLFKELCRISGEQLTGVKMNTIYKYNLNHEDLLYMLKALRAVYKGAFTMEELTYWIQKRVLI
jgi:hypothetical protein